MKRALLVTATGIVILGLGVLLGRGIAWRRSDAARGSAAAVPSLTDFTEVGPAKAASTSPPAAPQNTPATTQTPLPPAPPVAPTDAQAAKEKAYADAMTLAANEKLMEARAALTAVILDTSEDSPFRQKVKAALDDLNKKLFFSRLPTSDSIFYTVTPEDKALWDIAVAQKSSPELIMLVNGMGRPLIHAGDRLKIPKGTFSVIVEKKPFRLIVLLNGQYIKEYQVALGKEGSTPSAEFEVASRGMAKEPTWTAKDGKVYPFGHPMNPLGTRWIGFKTVDGYAGYGIHGTTDPKTIGTEASEGCVRMRNQDIEELFSMLRAGDKVLIRP